MLLTCSCGLADHPFPVAGRGEGGLQTSPQEVAFRWAGLTSWLASANAGLGAHPAAARTTAGGKPVASVEPDSTTPLELVLRLCRHPRCDAERKVRAARLLDWLGGAPPPLGPHITALVTTAANQA